MTLKGPAEVGAAAQAFNEMQARLKRYINDRTAMVGAISTICARHWRESASRWRPRRPV